jgi:hypothetical protein
MDIAGHRNSSEFRYDALRCVMARRRIIGLLLWQNFDGDRMRGDIPINARGDKE